jgi:hypothetical protein
MSGKFEGWDFCTDGILKAMDKAILIERLVVTVVENREYFG